MAMHIKDRIPFLTLHKMKITMPTLQMSRDGHQHHLRPSNEHCMLHHAGEPDREVVCSNFKQVLTAVQNFFKDANLLIQKSSFSSTFRFGRTQKVHSLFFA